MSPRTTPLDPDERLTTRQAGLELGVSPGRIRQFVLERRLPKEKLGRDLVVRRGDLEPLRGRRPGRPVGYRKSDRATGAGANAPASSEREHIRSEHQAQLASAATGVSRPVGGQDWLVPTARARPRRR
jgi:hypothetical protein